MKRVVPGVLIAVFWFLLLLEGSARLFCVVAVVIVLVAADEYLKMADVRRLSFFERLILSISLAAPVAFTCIYPQLAVLPPALLFSFLTLTCYFLYRYRNIPDSYALFCRLVFGLLYIGFLGAHLVLLRFIPDGGSWLIIGTAITACSDTGAYFVGRSIGKNKLCPNISPNKTIEGAIGGIVAGVMAAAGFALILHPPFTWTFLLIAAVFLSLVGIIGDLTESIIKRGTGTKDSGTLLAGHGGILDRADSLLFVGPVLYYLLLLPVLL
jgi:phosphatidate cytidylyltransferase